MNDLPARTPSNPPPVEVGTREPAPTWQELRERFTDLMKEIGAELKEAWQQEGKGLRREAATRLLPAAKRAKTELEKLIQRLEERLAKEP
jgi:hypothetical protein